MNKTIKLLKKIIFISNLDKYSKGFNNILFFGFISGVSELIIFSSSIYMIGIITTEKEALINPILIFIFILIGSILRIFSSKMIINYAHLVGSRIGKFLLKKRFSNIELYNLAENINDNIVVSVVNYTQIFVSSLQNISLAIAALISILSIVFLLSISYYLNTLFVIILISTIYVLISKFNSIKLSKISKKIASNQRSVLTNIREPLNMDEEIFINKSSEFYENKLYKRQLELMQNLASSSFISSLPKLVIEFFILSFISIILILDPGTISNRSFLNEIIILLISCLRIVPYAQSIYSAQSSIKIFSDPIEILYKYLTDNFVTNKNLKKIIVKDSLDYKIILSKGYTDSKNKIILNYKLRDKNDEISINIRANQILGIKGTSGCGKSTLIRSMLGLRNFYQIEATLNNMNFKASQIYKLRDFIKLGFIPQKSYIYTGSIKENILKNEKFRDEEIIKLLIKFNLSSNAKEAKELLNKKIGEKSSINLSGGEIQRLSFIRALLRRPTILYIDEATSALDDLNSEIIMNSLLDYAESVIVISHSKLNEKFYNQTLSFEKI